MTGSKTQEFPRKRIATIDVCAVGQQKHHISAMLEIDVTAARKKIKTYKNQVGRISFTAWLIRVISLTVKDHERVAGYRVGKRKVALFKEINVSMIVEKSYQGQKIPIPLIIEKANERSVESITGQITEARDKELTDKEIVLQNQSGPLERLYYHLPGFVRRFFWKYLVRHPHMAFNRMGNVAITSIGMIGKVNGWFIPISVHPICFGISNITKKPVVVEDKIEIREVLNLTILLDHDVIDGAHMARFISDLSRNMVNGSGLEQVDSLL